MSFQPNGGPSYCTARRYSLSSLGKGSFRSRLKGSLAQSFLGSLSSRWSLNNKEGFEDFIHNDNGIRLDPLVRKRKSLKDGLRQSSENVPRRNRSFSESWGRYPVNSGKMFLSRQNSPLRVDRSSSPGRWFNHQNTPPWQASPSLQRQPERHMRRRHRSDLSYQRRHRSSDGDILLGSKFAKQNMARNHRHSEGDILVGSEIINRKIARKHRNSEGDILYKNIESAKEPADLSIRTRKRCTSEGDVESANELSMNDPKSNTKFESDSNLLKDNEKEYVEAIISSLRRNSVTQKFREDILQRNGFYNSFRSDSMLENGRNTRHRNSYCGSFDSLDSIDSWSSCNSIENLDINSHDTPNNELSAQRRDIKEFPRIVEDNTGSACPDIIAAHKGDATHLNENEEDVQETEETSSWMDSSYWNLELLRKDVRPRSLPMSRRSSRRHRLKGIRARSLNDKDRWIRNNLHGGYMNGGDGNSNVGDSLANLKEEVEREIYRGVDETASVAESDYNTCNALQACEKECASYLEDSNEDTATGLAEFVSLQKDEITFCSGKHGNLDSGEDDVDLVFDAITKEANKLENSEKDLMVVFFVGGELKILRRSGYTTKHGDVVHSDLPSMTRKDLSTPNGSHDYRPGHTVHDINRGRPKSAIIVTRSHSFGGEMSDGPRDGSPGGAPQAVVLGESFRHHRGATTMPPHVKTSAGSRGAGGFGYKKSPKVPKIPRPNRALLMFQSVKKGLREFIEATKQDVTQLKIRETDSTSATAQQIKSAERYLKRLEFQLSKLEELHENYLLQQKLREGVRTMHKAYTTSPGNQRNTLSNVKYGYKECTQTMCQIEAQLENMMGTFNCKLKGMAGFARLCPGDVFEVTVRHGTQKWKTKGRVEKSGNQKWEIPEFTFKAVVGDIINIKGVELRAFKSVLLGQKSCEIKELFSANPQLMTVSINVNGSLKLSIIITWNPLDGMDESATYIEPAALAHGTPRRRPVSVIALNGEYGDSMDSERRFSVPASLQKTADDNFILRTQTPSHQTSGAMAYHGFDSPRVQNRHSDHVTRTDKSGALFGHVPYLPAGYHSSPYLPGDVSDSRDSREFKDNSVPIVNTQQTSLVSASLPSVLSHLHFPSVSLPRQPVTNSDDHSVLTLEDSLHSLRSSLEDYHGQYTELQRLEDLLRKIEKLSRKHSPKHSPRSSRSSSISVSIESALEAFDFLDTEDGTEEAQTPSGPKSEPAFDDLLCSPESTAKTGDSGIESLAQRLSEDTQLGSSLGSSPVPPTTGNEQVDQCLMYHLTYCERLLDNLGTFGPLKCREIYAIDKLQKQTDLIEDLVKIAKSGSEVDLHSVMSTLCDDKSLREFWVKCTDQHQLYIKPDRLLSALEQKYGSVLPEKHQLDPVTVCKHIITRILDVPDYDMEKIRPNFVMTLHQFMSYFNDEGGLKHVEAVAAEMKLIEKFTSGNCDIVIKAILMLRDTLPTPPCVKVLGMLLIAPDKEVEQCTISYLNLIQRRKESRDKAMITFVEGLEDRLPEIRSGACAALAILEASESTDQLAYLWQSDSSPLVQNKAKEALLSLGEEGKKAFEEAQLSRHGFQGVHVHKSLN